MEKTFLLFLLCVVLFLTDTRAQQRPDRHQAYPGRQNPAPFSHHPESSKELQTVLSEKWNDSIHLFNWNSLHSVWDIDVRIFRTRSQSGFVSERRYIQFDTTTHSWVNLWLDEMDYFPTGDELSTSYKLWDPGTSSWIQYSYTHFITPGNEDEYFYKNWDTVIQNYTYGYRYTYQYDLSGNQTEMIDFELDTVTGLWVNASKTTSTYGSAGITDQIMMNWDSPTSTWVNFTKTEYIYDANNYLDEVVKYAWNTSVWLLNSHSQFSNNAAGNPTQRLDEYWTGVAWYPYFKIGYTYDPSGTRVLTKLDQSFNTVFMTWDNKYRVINTYFPSGFTTTSLSEMWNSISSSWMDWSFNEYDVSGNNIESYYKSIDPSTFVTNYGSRYLCLYDANSRYLQETKQNYDTASGTWSDYSRDQCSYEDPINSYYIEELGSLWDGVTWVNDYKYILYWSYPSGIGNTTNQVRLCFHENPIKPGNRVNCPFLDPSKDYQFDLFSMNGQRISSEQINQGTSFVIDPIPAGTYILRISENGRMVYREKVVILSE